MSSRRDFMGMALGGFTALGGLGALYAMKRTWDPLPSVKSAGFTSLDLKDYQENQLAVEKWRGKPIFILKQSNEMLSKYLKMLKRDLLRLEMGYYYGCSWTLYTPWCIPGFDPRVCFLCAVLVNVGSYRVWEPEGSISKRG